MTRSLAEKICCPFDKQDLELQVITEHEESGEIVEALLTCPGCERYFPVVYGIPIMIPDRLREEEMERPLLKEWGYELKEGKPHRLRLEE